MARRFGRLIRPLDVPVIAVSVTLAVLPWITDSAAEVQDKRNVAVSVRGRTLAGWPLPVPRETRRDTISGALGPVVIASDSAGVRIVSSGCPRKLCVEYGTLSSTRGGIVCAPNGVLVTLEGRHEGGGGPVDGVTQ